MTAHSAEGNTSSCQTRRWDQELGLVPKADMASQITDLRMGGMCGCLLSLPAPTKGKPVPKTDVYLSANPFSAFHIYSLCFLYYDSGQQQNLA